MELHEEPITESLERITLGHIRQRVGEDRFNQWYLTAESWLKGEYLTPQEGNHFIREYIFEKYHHYREEQDAT